MNDSLQKDKKHVLVIGNGFDLDIGLKTTYKSFAESDYWPFNNATNEEHSLAGYLNAHKNSDSWFDLEMLLANYGSKDRNRLPSLNHQLPIEEDKRDFRILCSRLSEYLYNEQINADIDEQSIAGIFLTIFCYLIGEKKVYSFNYTDIKLLGERMNLEVVPNCEHIHGSLKYNDIILGVSDKIDLDESYNFLYKSSNHTFQCNEIIPDLEDADHVVIFVHSLGNNDYDYFEDFFTEACKRRKGEGEYKRKIVIITKDLQSELAIKSHIRHLTQKQTQRLASVCDFRVMCTDNFQDLIDYLFGLNNEFPEDERPYNLPEDVHSLKDFERKMMERVFSPAPLVKN